MLVADFVAVVDGDDAPDVVGSPFVDEKLAVVDGGVVTVVEAVELD